jgi:hypothetical protein
MRTLCALVAVLLIGGPVLAGGHRADAPLAFSPVPDYGAPASRPALVADVAGIPSDVRPVRPHRRVRPPALPQDPARALTTRPSTSLRRSGIASWYCCTHGYPTGLYGAAGPALRTGHWRGRTVQVGSGSRMVRVTLVDWCACPDRLIDLYPAAFSRLGPLSRGLLNVKVSW